MRYLVTGGFGFMGSWVAEHLAHQGHEVFILSRRAPSAMPKIHSAHSFADNSAGATPAQTSGSALIQADLTALSPEELAKRLPDALDGCVHAASYNESFMPDYARKALQVNAYGTRNLLEALALKAEQAAAPLPTVVYCSTFHVYGRTQGYIDENTPPAPRNDYALTHFFGEEYCRFFGRTRNLPHITIRCTNGYGAPRHAPFDKWYLLFNDLCRNALTKGNVTLRSNPALLRDFIWMGDVAAAIAALLTRADLSGSVFNLSRGAALTIGHIAELAANVASQYTGNKVPLILEHTQPTLGANDNKLTVSNDALLRATGIVLHDVMKEEMRAILEFLTLHGDA